MVLLALTFLRPPARAPSPRPPWAVFVLRLCRLQVVDRADDDAWGLSSALPIGVEVVAVAEPTSESLSASKLALVIGLCTGGEEALPKILKIYTKYIS